MKDYTDKFCLGPPEAAEASAGAEIPASPPLALPNKTNQPETPEQAAARITATRERIFAGYTKGIAKR